MNNLEQYCIEHSVKETEILKKIKDFTFENEAAPQMISESMVGNILSLLIKLINAQNILEIGMFTGYSAMTMAQALPENGKIHTCEIMDCHIKTANEFFKQSKHGSKITIHKGSALYILEQFKSGSFDMAFIDADKSNYLEYYKRCLMLVRKGGVILLDNMLWSGSVVDPQDDDSKALRKTGDYIQEDKRVFNILFPIRDGLMLCIKK